MFSGARHLSIHGGSFVSNAGRPSSLDRLIGEVAPNAILNAGGRADEVRCFPGTREEVIGSLEKFMNDNSPGEKRMMWLSGPAGAGKSAICQTVAERRSEQGRQAANFFFFRGDRTRNHSRPLVPTLVYQLRQLYPALDELLAHCLKISPRICNASIQAQFKELISSSIQMLPPIQGKIVIIVDGLDECNNYEREQDQIIVALHTLAYAFNSPFLILVSSRAESQLVMSFNRLGSSVESIFLNEDYQPAKDIRLFVVAKFAEIRKNHHLARSLSKEWPADADIDAIVDKSSNQFIYAATVMRFIQFSSENPGRNLTTILAMPLTRDHNPLALLDAVYSHIFSKARNIRAVKLILFAKIRIKSDFEPFLRLVGYDNIDVQSFFADLVSITLVNTELPPEEHGLLTFYHASLEDYLGDESRSTIYYLNEHELALELSLMCLRNIHDIDSIGLTTYPLSHVQTPTPALSKSLFDASRKRLKGKESPAIVGQLIFQIERLYWEHDKDQFKLLLEGWTNFVLVNQMDDFSNSVQTSNPSTSLFYKQYWKDVVKNNKVLSYGVQEPECDSGRPRLKRKVRQLHGMGRTSDVGHSPEYYDDGPLQLSVIRVKVHYQDDTRGMTLSSDTPFPEFVSKVTTKFGKNSNDLNMKFKDEDGASITLCDESDYEHAIETVRQSSKGSAEGKLEIWCRDSAS